VKSTARLRPANLPPVAIATGALVLLLAIGLGTYVGVKVLGISTRPNGNEIRFWGLTNGSRANVGAGQVVHDYMLNTCARDHSQRMANRGTIYHSTNSQLYRCAEGRFRAIGENVGVGTSLYGIQRAFYQSRDHRQNLLDRRYVAIGVGVILKERSYYVTIIFGGHR
jgi:uncharacterized protein YkwD